MNNRGNGSRAGSDKQGVGAGSKHERSKSRGSSQNCRDEVEFIGDYLGNNLSAAERLAFETHLNTCPDCAAFLTTYKKTVAVTRSFLRLGTRENHTPRLTLRSSDQK
jgi:hypothetical protein